MCCEKLTQMLVSSIYRSGSNCPACRGKCPGRMTETEAKPQTYSNACYCLSILVSILHIVFGCYSHGHSKQAQRDALEGSAHNARCKSRLKWQMLCPNTSREGFWASWLECKYLSIWLVSNRVKILFCLPLQWVRDSLPRGNPRVAGCSYFQIALSFSIRNDSNKSCNDRKK